MNQLINSFKTAGLFLIASMAIISCNSGNSNSALNTTIPSPDTVSAAVKTSPEPAPMKDSAIADLKALTDTTLNGTVDFTAEPDGKVKMKLALNIPQKANKSVAVHIHATGDCGDMGKAAGGHWNPTNAQHGKWGSSSFHSGDIGNVKLDMNGKGTMELETDLWSLGGDTKTNILGKAFMVHGGEDDFVSQPAGNAGSRIGCGVIQ
ncbi:MAG TPA: superoxide dismutase family protein [Hanamia sp.]